MATTPGVCTSGKYFLKTERSLILVTHLLRLNLEKTTLSVAYQGFLLWLLYILQLRIYDFPEEGCQYYINFAKFC